MKKRNLAGEPPSAGTAPDSASERSRRFRLLEGWSSAGLLLIAVAVAGPFFCYSNAVALEVFKWGYLAGALLYTVARILAARIKGDSLRVRRFRRMEVWAGMAFCIGAFFWFFNAERFGAYGFGLKVISETVTFTLAGAVLQIIASWMLSSALRKESGDGREKSGERGEGN